ncbi:MAG: hypothetical protein RBR87_05880 [Bacteroidales bacterium]|jgi:hypothetical protein|nr:hypothetical protein [Bacteroidales bacterium]
MMAEQNINTTSNYLFDNIVLLVEKARSKAAIFLNTETALLYWFIGFFIQTVLKQKGALIYGKQIFATLSQQFAKAQTNAAYE